MNSGIVASACAVDPRSVTSNMIATPTAAAELAIALVDVSADGFVHWVVAGLPVDVGVIDPTALPAGAVQARSSSGIVGWDGPCPPPGDVDHRYEVRAYALSEPLGLAPGTEGRAAVELLDDAAIGRAILSATYGADG